MCRNLVLNKILHKMRSLRLFILMIQKQRPIKNWFMFSVRISSYGCTREVWRARKKRKSSSSTNSSSVLPTSQVVYQPMNQRNLWSILRFYNNSEDFRFFHEFTGTIYNFSRCYCKIVVC